MKRIITITILFALISIGLNAESKEKATKTVKINQTEFVEKVYNYKDAKGDLKFLGDKPVIVDFYADWCPPCKKIAPILEELAAEYEGEIIIYKVNTDHNRELASAFGITSIPTLYFIPMKGKPEIVQGAMPKKDMKEAIDKFLLKK